MTKEILDGTKKYLDKLKRLQDNNNTLSKQWGEPLVTEMTKSGAVVRWYSLEVNGSLEFKKVTSKGEFRRVQFIHPDELEDVS